ncbi:helix-turn-helix domain-containing protein [Lentzea sp. NPDC051838]|uniref:sigma-54-dependent Fis family transcriptional regulator n=1 Tax=Lentzea sp. NPDC051838 TaxID=3154849 RepID=UPI00342DC7CD
METDVSRARDRFLSGADEPGTDVRQTILASWERSRESGVDADRILAPFIRDPDLETPLVRSAAPVLDGLHEQLRGEAVSIILTDHTGLVLDRRGSTNQMTQALDDVQLMPGFSYAERFVGTNGIGTAISSGLPAFVDGREHYTGELGKFACAGTPIRHPVRGTVMGVLDITTWSQTPGPMVTALASSTARQIEAELRNQTGQRELALVHEYMRICQRTSGPVLALNNDVVMMNDALRHQVDPAEQQILIGYSIDMMRVDTRQMQRTVELPSGRTAHLRYSPASMGSALAGGVFRIRIERSAPTPLRLLLPQRSTLLLPGLAGSGPAWSKAVEQCMTYFVSRDWFIVEGEPGTGKLSLLRAVHQHRSPGRHFRVVEPPAGDEAAWRAELAACLAVPEGTVVLTRAHELPSDLALVGAASRVVVTGTPAPMLRSLFPRAVEVPALRHHIDDLPDLVSHLLRQLTKGDEVTCSPSTLAHLARLDWPGNISQLRRVLATTIRRRPRGVIEVDDLPPECRSVTHRRLTPLEALERDAIITALADNDENPTKAAQAIGMSRATIYRKIRQYGIQ